MIRREYPFVWRRTEFFLLLCVGLLACLGFAMVHVSRLIKQEMVEVNFLIAIIPALVLMIFLFGVHLVLSWRSDSRKPSTVYQKEQLILPIVGTLLALGLVMIDRLLPFNQLESVWSHFSLFVGCYTRVSACPAVWQQISRGLFPGIVTLLVIVSWPQSINFVQRGKWPLMIGGVGLFLLLATAFFGIEDESGARLALKLPGLPVIQTTELIKLALIIFMAWFIESSGKKIAGRPVTIGPLQLPQLRYVWLSLLFVGMAVLFLIKMSDWGAILILLGLFVGIAYIGLEPRLFRSTAIFTFVLASVVAIIILNLWSVPPVIENRWLAYKDPWSTDITNFYGRFVTVADGPGYQVQQSIYAIVAGGMVGADLGFGNPGHIPVPYSDYILAAMSEELGLIVMLPVFAFFLILIWRLLRVSMVLSEGEVFERVLLTGIAIHLSLQVLIMAAGVTKALPATGVTVAFLSLGGMALWVNLAEIGIALVLSQREEN